jgi:hypothetical protein
MEMQRKRVMGPEMWIRPRMPKKRVIGPENQFLLRINH